MSMMGRVGDAVARRPLALVGLGLVLAGSAHFVTWTEGVGPGRRFADAIGQGTVTSAAPELAAYATGHPAYVAAVVVGVALVLRSE